MAQTEAWAGLDSNQRRRKASRFTVCPVWPLRYLPGIHCQSGVVGGGILKSLTSDLPDRSPELERTYIVLSNLARKLIFKESNLVGLLQNLLFDRDRTPELRSVNDVSPVHLDAIDGVRVCICLQMTDFIQCAET